MTAKRPILTKLVEEERHLDGLDVGDKVRITYGNSGSRNNISAVYEGQDGERECFAARSVSGIGINSYRARREDLRYVEGTIVFEELKESRLQAYFRGSYDYIRRNKLLRAAEI